MRAFVSIHDLMPHTLPRVERILDWLQQHGVPPVTLLVVPGLPWEPAQINRLRELAEMGHPLAAHGWFHRTRPRRLTHRLHAALISRNVAEHLDLNSAQILALLHRARDWFPEHDLPAPDFYVPPAWALGPIRKTDLTAAPYRHIEITRGILFLERTHPHAPARVHLEHLPLTGYEADTPARAGFLRRWNTVQWRTASRRDRTLRISIHPHDLELRLADQLAEQIKAVDTFDHNFRL
ncbi:MAG: DUF2334 domain-containing protein [Opitutales bacterium]